ncbi:MAG: 2-oxoacid:acceptor oxidoreductase subunit alpha [Thermodesulfobacteriota bacterium]
MARASVALTIAGEAGQGLVTIGELLVKGLNRAGFRLLVTQDYLSRIRGGINAFTILTGAGEIISPRETVDLLIALNQEAVVQRQNQVAPDGLVVAGTGDCLTIPRKILCVPYQELADSRSTNMAALGVAGALLGLGLEALIQTLERAFGRKHPEAATKNAEALSKAYAWCREQGPSSLTLASPAAAAQRLTLNGNEAIALGALAAGVKFCAFYPMTPATSIPLNLAARAEKMGLVVEQAEDEIAAVNMAIGAAYAGAPSLVSTSGGGFALMAEGVSLAGMMETPLVLVVCQRPGPATGLPTRTEQADLEFVLHAGHGEFPRAVFAPGTIEECFHLTRRAFDLAERYQSPVFVLSDQFLADSYRSVAPFDLDGLEVNPAAGHAAALAAGPSLPYRRYALTASGVSPRLLPGLSEHLVVTDSDEHTEDGHLTEDLTVRVQMHEKRLRKMEGLAREIIAPEFIGEEKPELLLVSWGSSRGAVLAAAAQLGSEGRKTAVLHFSQVWPLAPAQFLERLERAARVIAVEGNAFGQLARLIRRESGFEIKEAIRRYDGLHLTPEYIRRNLAG